MCPKFLNQIINIMGYFTIDLPSGKRGEVRFGKIFKKSVNFFDLFRKKGVNREEKTGYIVKIEPAPVNRKLYRLLKSKEGEWLKESDGGFPVETDDETSIAIKKAIDGYEKQQVDTSAVNSK
jgi:hypothetical protein